MEPNLKRIIIPAAITAASVIALLIVRLLAFGILNRWAAKTETRIDDIIIKALRAPSIYWAAAIGIYIGIAVSELGPKHALMLGNAIHILIILSVTSAVANLACKILENYVERLQVPIPATGLAQGLIKGTLYLVGALIALSVAGISIAPLLTALGVGGLAVALGLKDTLANLFAGIHILVERSIRVGDFVRLETGQEGYVDDITWRTTRIRMLPNNMVVVPNDKLSQSVVTNYSMPEKRMSFPISVSVSYDSNPEEVERILVEEAKAAVGAVPGLLGEPEPLVRFMPGFGANSLDFTLVCHIGEFVEQYLVQHELRKRIFRRLKAEGIEIPFPQRTVHLKKDEV